MAERVSECAKDFLVFAEVMRPGGNSPRVKNLRRVSLAISVFMVMSINSLTFSARAVESGPSDPRDNKVISKDILIFEGMINLEASRIATTALEKSTKTKEYKKIWDWGKGKGLEISRPVPKGKSYSYVKSADYSQYILIKEKSGGRFYCSIEDSVFGRIDNSNTLKQSLYPMHCDEVLRARKK